MQCHNPSLHHTNNATKASPLNCIQKSMQNAYDSTRKKNKRKKVINTFSAQIL